MTFFPIQLDNVDLVGVLHHNLESSFSIFQLLQETNYDAIAIELPESCQDSFIDAVSRLPDLSVIEVKKEDHRQLYLVEPVDPCYEAMRQALEKRIPCFCIDQFVGHYDFSEILPDAYSLFHLGASQFYDTLNKAKAFQAHPQDIEREQFMAARLKVLSLRYDRVLMLCGMAHLDGIQKYFYEKHALPQEKVLPTQISLQTLDETSAREVMQNYGFISLSYEAHRIQYKRPKHFESLPESLDRKELYHSLIKQAANLYENKTGYAFKSYHLKNLLKFSRNYAHIERQLFPSLYQILESAKACVDANYAYELWQLATAYPLLKNIDNLPEASYKLQDFWPHVKKVRFHLKQRHSKQSLESRYNKSKNAFKFFPAHPYSMCSHTPEDSIIENFGKHLQKRSSRIYTESTSKTLPFSGSLEEGIDIKESLRHWFEKKLYVKTTFKRPSKTGSVVVIFDEDLNPNPKYPWCTSWLGEHDQESDMAFYATSMHEKIIGPGICRCEYGGFMLSYPPRRLFNPFTDPEYEHLNTKAEVLLWAAIDYSTEPLIVYAANFPPNKPSKLRASRFGKKIIYVPLQQISNVLCNKIKTFHVLASQQTRNIADDYIF